MTLAASSDTNRRVGRKLLWPDKVIAPLPRGTLARIDAARRAGEDKTDFLREAVERELVRREREARRRPS